MAHCNGPTERMLDYIKRRGCVERSDLRVELCLAASAITAHLKSPIERGIVVVERRAREVTSGRPSIHYRWVGGQDDASPPGPKDAAKRKCLGCGNEFHSAHAGNRLCTRCRNVEASPFAIAL